MNITHWNPWREFDDLFSRLSAPAGEPFAGGEWLPAVDVRESENAYHIDLEIPAVAPEDVDVSLEGGVLTVTGERRSESESERGKAHRVERRWGRFTRSFRLPDNVDPAGIEARARDGVLYLTIGKRADAQRRRIEVH